MRLPHISPRALPVVLAAMIFVISAAAYGWRWNRETDSAPRIHVGPQLATAADTVSPPPVPASARWPAPVAQARGTLWRFGLFTPPEIHFDRVHGNFTIIPPEVPTEEGLTTVPAEDTGLGFKLHAVQREPYPLQLVGYIGDASDLLGTFENTVTGETLVLRQGARIEVPGLVLERLVLVREATNLPESMTVRETKIRAELRELGSGQRLTLEQGAIAYTGRLQAVISTAADPSARVCFEGEAITERGNRFRIEKIRLAPPSVDVTKDVSGEPDPSRPPVPTAFTLHTPR